MRTAVLLSILAIVSIVASINMPTFASIPSGLHTSIPEPPPTRCDEYSATPATERMDDWIYTLQQGLRSNPVLALDVWDCIMDTYKVAETDQFMLRLCREKPNAAFNDLAIEALSAHLDQCGIGIKQ